MKPPHMTELALEGVRRAIDAVDDGLIVLLAARGRLVGAVARLKRRSGHGAFDAARAHCQRSYKPVSAATSMRPLVRWASMHSALLGLGLMRPPASIEQLGRAQPIKGIALPRPLPGIGVSTGHASWINQRRRGLARAGCQPRERP